MRNATHLHLQIIEVQFSLHCCDECLIIAENSQPKWLTTAAYFKIYPASIDNKLLCSNFYWWNDEQHGFFRNLRMLNNTHA